MIACLFSCEHATCAVPEAFRELFKGSEEIVTSTKGWDPGALNLAQAFSMKFRTPLVHGDVTRLLIDLNEGGEERWSRISRTLPEGTRAKLVERHEKPYRATLDARILEDLSRNPSLLHIMVHTEEGESELTLETSGQGIAAEFASQWRARLAADGVTAVVRSRLEGELAAYLLAKHPADRYALVRLKVPQGYFLQGKPLRWETLKKFLVASLFQVAGALDVPQPE